MKGVGVLLFYCIDDWTSVVMVYKVQPGYIWYLYASLCLQSSYTSRV